MWGSALAPPPRYPAFQPPASSPLPFSSAPGVPILTLHSTRLPQSGQGQASLPRALVEYIMHLLLQRHRSCRAHARIGSNICPLLCLGHPPFQPCKPDTRTACECYPAHARLSMLGSGSRLRAIATHATDDARLATKYRVKMVGLPLPFVCNCSSEASGWWIFLFSLDNCVVDCFYWSKPSGSTLYEGSVAD